jgi:ABC-type Fe3+/spermidine/putrescine transport system ATPase subunit
MTMPDPYTHPAIRTVNLQRTFRTPGGEFIAVDGVDIAIEDGEFVCLLGPSGCGKTTVLRMLAGLEEPTDGQIFIHGENVTFRPTAERGVRMMFQDFALFPHMTAAENVQFGLTVRRMRGTISKAAAAKRAGEYLELVGLSDFRDRRPHQLSGGQRQRVALARALATEPPIVLFDESLSALDAGLRRQMQSELRRLQRELGKTFVFVTHDQTEAMTMSDRIAIMRKGKIAQYGTPSEIYNDPNSIYVANFMGTTNLLPGQVTAVERDGMAIQTAAGGRFLSPRAAASVGDTATIMFRADGATLAAPANAADGNSVDAVVRHMAFLGPRIEYELVTADGSEILVHAPATDGGRFAPGSPVAVSIAPDAMRILYQ